MQILILDGALGTELVRRGWDVSDSLWSARVLLDNPEAIEQIHFDYLQAGARCITAGSYQISFEGFEKASIAREDTANALTMSVALPSAPAPAFSTFITARSLPQKSFCKRSCSFQTFQRGFRLPAAMVCTPFMEH